MGGVRGRPFEPGNTKGRGRPKGSRNKATEELEALLDQYAKPILSKCVYLAMKGNVHCLRMLMDRIIPIRRDRDVQLALPATATMLGVETAVEIVLQAIGTGKISPAEGETVTNILEIRRRTIETVGLQQRIQELEEVAETIEKKREVDGYYDPFDSSHQPRPPCASRARGNVIEMPSNAVDRDRPVQGPLDESDDAKAS